MKYRKGPRTIREKLQISWAEGNISGRSVPAEGCGGGGKQLVRRLEYPSHGEVHRAELGKSSGSSPGLE